MVPRIATRKVGAACASFADEERVTGKDPVRKQQRQTVARMPGCVQHFQRNGTELERIAFVHPVRRTMRPREGVHDIGRMRVVTQRRAAGNVIRVRVRVDDVREFPAFLFQQPNVLIDAFKNRIDNRHFARFFASNQIRATCPWIELLENHGYCAAPKLIVSITRGQCVRDDLRRILRIAGAEHNVLPALVHVRHGQT